MNLRILVANDDGIYSPGIIALARVAARFGEVRIVAPDVEQSSSGHAITASRPLSYHKVSLQDFEAYKVNGTPADCVALGTYNWERVDLVLSGINLGLNLGNSCWHSGTLAAAKQAALLGLRGMAISAPLIANDKEFQTLEPYLEHVIEQVLKMDSLRLVNVNFPPRPHGVRWTRQSVRHYDGKMVAGTDPLGRTHYWFVVTPLTDAEENTDRWAVENGWVSVTPLRLDLTDEEELRRMRTEFPFEESLSADIGMTTKSLEENTQRDV